MSMIVYVEPNLEKDYTKVKNWDEILLNKCKSSLEQPETTKNGQDASCSYGMNRTRIT